jgi:O-antigen ligase
MSSPRVALTRNWTRPSTSEVPLEKPSRLAHVVPVGLMALVVFGPLAFGGVEEWAILVLRAGAALLFFAWSLQQLSNARVEVVANGLYFPAVVFGLLVALQIVFHRSEYGYATLNEGLNYVAYAALFFLTAQSFQHRSELRRLAIVLTAFGFGFAVFATMQSFSGSIKLYWIRQPHSINAVIFGSYVNHNHYAGLMELLIPVPLLLSVGGVWRGAKRILCAFAAVVMCASLFLSKSRGGMVALVIQLLFVAAISVHRRSKRVAAFLLVACVFVVALLLWLDTSGIVRERVSTLANPLEAAGTRLMILHDGLKMVRVRPVLGWGLDTFPVVYPQFRSFSTDLFVNEAHNDYLQVLVEMGVAGFLVVLWFICLLYKEGLPHRDTWTHDLKSAVRMAALVGCTGILVHSFFDFNLHIPANAVLFYVLAALATSGRISQKENTQQSPERLR